MRKSDKLNKNLYDKKALEILNLTAGNYTKPKINLSNIRDDLMSKLCYHCFPGFLLFREEEIVQWVCQPWVRVNVVLLLLSYPLPFFQGVTAQIY